MQDPRDAARGFVPRERKIRLIARLNAPRMLNAKTQRLAWDAFQKFTKPGQTHKYFDLDHLKEVMGNSFDFSVNFHVMTARTAGRRRGQSLPGSTPERMIGFSADIIVKSKGDQDVSDHNIAPLLEAIAAAADRQAHDRELGQFISIGETVPLIGAHRPRPLPPSLRPDGTQLR